jgi:hypothetical protein
MTHQEAVELLELYLLGTLDEDDQQGMEEHLATGCRDCARGLQEAADVNASILASVPLVDPPGRLRDRILSIVDPPKPKPRAQPHYLPWMAAAAAVALTVWVGREARDKNEQLTAAREQVRTLTDQKQQLDTALAFLSDPQTRPVNAKEDLSKPRGTYFVNAQSGLLLIASNLPALPPGKIYQMWLIPKGGAPKPAGLFRPDAKGGAVHVQPGAVDVPNAAAVAITVEPESGSAAPTTTPFLVTPVAGL